MECTADVTNVGKAALPVQFGYHPYLCPDGPRELWTLGMRTQKHWIASEDHLPSGDTEPTDRYLPGVTKSITFDMQFIEAGLLDFKRDSQGFGHIWTKGKTEKIEVVYGKEFDYAIGCAPLSNTLICIGPQVGPTNTFNLEHEGK